jgi:hypothetical protein
MSACFCPVTMVVNFWRRPVRAEPLALFRIVLGITYLSALLIGLAPDLNRYLDLCPPETLDKWLGTTGRWSIFRAPAYFPERTAADGPFISEETAAIWNTWGAKRDNVFLMFALLVVAVLGMTLGCYTRLCATIAWLLTISFHNRLLWTINGGDDMFRTGLFYVAIGGIIGWICGERIAPAAAVWSLDRRRQIRNDPAAAEKPVYIAPWSVRLIQIQLCAVYFFTGLAKIGADWIDGTALYWVLNDLSLTRWPYSKLPVPMWMCQLASWGTLVWEIGFPLLVAVRWFRPWTLLAGVALHIGILLSMEVGWFSQVTLCWYAVFLNGDMLAGFAARLFGRRSAAPESVVYVPADAYTAATP